jgi:hypothetical protein
MVRVTGVKKLGQISASAQLDTMILSRKKSGFSSDDFLLDFRMLNSKLFPKIKYKDIFISF